VLQLVTSAGGGGGGGRKCAWKQATGMQLPLILNLPFAMPFDSLVLHCKDQVSTEIK
jgi:hypothetical protein